MVKLVVNYFTTNNREKNLCNHRNKLRKTRQKWCTLITTWHPTLSCLSTQPGWLRGVISHRRFIKVISDYPPTCCRVQIIIFAVYYRDLLLIFKTWSRESLLLSRPTAAAEICLELRDHLLSREPFYGWSCLLREGSELFRWTTVKAGYIRYCRWCSL